MPRDITRALHGAHPVWPGDPPMNLDLVARIADGDPVNVSRLELGVHTGTHLDAPWHYDDGGARLHELDLAELLGPCAVVQARGDGPVRPGDVLPVLDALDGASGGRGVATRVLIGTGEPNAWAEFPSRFRPLAVELVHALADRGVRLVGTDAPSVDALGAEGLPVHAAFARRDLLIVEGLALDGVPEGPYELVCLPLHLRGADGAPVRAVLHDLQRA